MGEDDGVGKFEMKLILELGANHFGTKFCEHYYIMKLLEDVWRGQITMLITQSKETKKKKRGDNYTTSGVLQVWTKQIFIVFIN